LVAKHPEQVHDLAVKVVVNLGVAPRLAKQNRSPATERLDIHPMGREVANDPRG
jgi:hypothetical protein